MFSIIYLNPPSKSCHVIFFSNGRIDSLIYKYNHNKYLLIIIIFAKFIVLFLKKNKIHIL